VTGPTACLLAALAATATAPTPGAPAPTTVAGAEAFPRKDVAPLVKEVFAGGFSFCGDPDYALTPDELKWCALMPKHDARCPTLERACSRGATAEVVGKLRHEPASPSFSMPYSPLLVRVLLWTLLVGIAAFLIHALIRAAMNQRPPLSAEVRVDVATGAAEDPAAALARQVETDVQRLLERARAAAGAGDFAAAIGDAYAALLRKLEGAQIVTIESHRTNGDHVRDVGRQRPALRSRMQGVVSHVEEVHFGGAPPTDSRFRAVLNDVLGLLSEKLAALLPVTLVVKVGLAFALGALFAGCKINRDVWDRSPSGRAGVFDLLERYGFKPRERLASLSKIDSSVPSLVLLPGANVDDAGWAAIGTWVGEGGTVIVAGGERVLPPWMNVTIADDGGKGSQSAPLTVPADQRERLPGNLTVAVPAAREVRLAGAFATLDDAEEPSPVSLLVRGRKVYAVERTYDGGGRAIILADDRLLTNASLLVGDNARLLIELLRPGGPRIEMAGELTGLVSQNPVTSVERSHLAPAMLQLILLVLLFFIYKGAHFGRPIDPLATSRRRFAEHARAVGMLYGRNRAGRHALEIYGSYALERLRERLNLSGGKSLLAVAEEVATRTGRPLGDVMRVLVESRPAKRDADPERERILQEANAAKDLATLRDVATLLERTGGAGERSRTEGQA
jgi:hypothetical protein